MKILLSGLTVLTLTTAAAHAGGIDRSSLPLSVLFADGTTAHLGFSSVTPSVSGAYVAPLTAFGPSTGNMAENYTTLNFAMKMDFNDKFSGALMMNQPYGADAQYTGGAYTGLEAHWSSSEIAAILKYKVNGGLSVYGGVRNVTSKAEIMIPALLLGGNSYQAVADSNSQMGYLIGAAYEKPEIALRASLTYQSAITHDFATSELFTPPGGEGAKVAAAPIPGGINTITNITLPQSVTLDVQSGIAANTLLFGSVKWAEWSKWHVDPAVYRGATGQEVTGFDNDVITYQLGIGRKINDNLSVFARVGYEASTGDVASRLAPTDGMQSIGIGGSWTQNNMKITGGVEYVTLGDAVDGSGTRFSGNSAMGLGVSVDFSF